MPAATTRPVRTPSFIATAIVLLAAWVYLAWPWLSGRVTVPWDAKAHFQAQFDFLAASIGAGDSPFWNPYIFAGWPQVADPQSMIFNPAFALVALFDHAPSFAAMDAVVFGSLGLGALGLVGYFRDRGWHPAGGMVAALSFAFGGSAAWRVQHTGQIMSIAVLPIVMFLLNRALMRRSFGWGLLAGLAAGVLALGRDQVALLGVYLLIGMVVAHLLGGHVGARIRGGIAPLLGGMIGGVLVVAVPVALTFVLAQESNRPSIDFDGAGIASMHPVSFITLFNPDLFGMRLHDPKVDFWGPPSEAFGVTLYIARNMAEVYAGMIPAFALLMWGIGRKQLFVREIRYFSFALIFAAFYTVGWHTPAFRLMFDYIPGVKLYRRPADATFLFCFLVSVIGGWLLHRWLTDQMPRAKAEQRIVQLILAVLVLGALPWAFAKHADHVQDAIRPSVETVGVWGATIVALALAYRLNRRSALAATALLAAFTAADLGFQISGRVPSPDDPTAEIVRNESTAYPPSTFDAMRVDTRDPTVAFLKQRVAADSDGQHRDRIELVGLGFHWPNISMTHRLDNTLGYNPLRLKMYEAAAGAKDHVAVPDQRNFSAPLFPSYRSLLADMLGLRWIALGVPVETIDKKLTPGDLKLVSEKDGVWIYENPRALPRVLFVPEAKTADFAGITSSGQWPDGFDPTRTVLLGADQPIPTAASLSTPPPDLSKAASLVTYRNTEVVIETDSPVAGYLVLNDVYHRWWHAALDDQPAPLLQANVIFRAVAVPQGKHRVRFTFHPFEGALADLRAMRGR